MNLKKIRMERGKNQKEVATELGMPPQYLSRYEKNQSEPDIETLKKLATYYHTTIDNLLDYQVPYLLDKSTLTQEQREIVEIVPSLNYEECKLLLAYLSGVKKGIEERDAKFYTLKGEN